MVAEVMLLRDEWVFASWARGHKVNWLSSSVKLGQRDASWAEEEEIRALGCIC
jgi:hypothetical protein